MVSEPRSVRGLNVAVLGLGKSGRAAARLALARGAASVYASDTGSGGIMQTVRHELEQFGARVEVGRHDLERIRAADLVVTSPGIPPNAPTLAALRDRRVIAELELASWYVGARLVAITGTNGKTTTTALLQAICLEADVSSVAAGNIGFTLSEVALTEHDFEWVVCETSSFQLAGIESFHPRVGVLTNLTPDHLDRYPDFASYAADKEALTRNMTEADVLILNADDDGSRGFAPAARATRHAFTTGRPLRPGVGIRKGQIVQVTVEGHERTVAAVDSIRLLGPHNLQNALAASLAALLMEVPPPAVAAALRSFTGVPHRLEEVARVDGVAFVNDSKATNVDSATWALRSFHSPLLLILGGRHKGSSYATLLPEMAGKVKEVFAIGEARERIAGDLGGQVSVRLAGSLEEAVLEAFRAAAGGDTVLLSPACSSYDMFRDFEERGERFREIVRSLRRSPAFARDPRRRREACSQ
jgi:UDP-N-acetylmuramoylalanine--D-glutamate ligase